MKILFIETVHSLLKEQLEKNGHICKTAYDKNKDQIEKIIDQYEGIIIRSKFKIDKKFIDKANKLKFIARAGSGMENIDVKYAVNKNISCYNAAEGNSQAVAEHAIGLLLCLFNNIAKSNREISKGKWEREENRGIEINRKKIGIIGYGNTGKALTKLLESFNAEIFVYDKYLLDYKYKSTMQEIYNNVDILSLHIPLTKETTYLINDDFINKFHKPFYLINTSRGKCVNTKSLVNALKSGKINGACLDVIEYEDPSFIQINKKPKELNYLINSKKTILTSHIAGWTKESNLKIAETLFKKIMHQN